MRTTLGTRTTVQTSSEEEGFKGPEDIGDIGGFGGELGGSSGSPSRRSPMGGIDLGKGIDLEKPRAPRSGIGFEVGKSPAGNLGLGLEIPLPVAAPVSARGGVSIDPTTGEIRGGYGGLGIGKGPIGASVDVGVDTPKGSEDFGCFKYVTFNVGPFSHTVSKNECEPKQPKGTSPTSTPTETTWERPVLPIGRPNIYCKIIVAIQYSSKEVNNDGTSRSDYEYKSSGSYLITGAGNKLSAVQTITSNYPYPLPANNPRIYSDTAGIWGYSATRRLSLFNRIVNTSNPDDGIYQPSGIIWGLEGFEIDIYNFLNNGIYYNQTQDQLYYKLHRKQTYTVIYSSCSLPSKNNLDSSDLSATSSPTSFFPLPNPPPTKKKMDDKCCKAIIQLQLETLRLLGRQLGPNGVMAQSKEKGFIGEEIERTLTPINNPNNPEKVKVRFTTVYQMLMYALKQGIALDTALDPQSYKVPTGMLQNPAYSRDSEHSLKSNDQPNKDKAGNSRELEINKDDAVKMSGFLQQQSYMFKMLQRLEYLFPPGELKDALIAKSLLIPGAKGDIKIHNMIMAYEIQMQYLDATLGNPREILTIKDANPAIEGDQPIEIQSLSVSDLLRQNIKFHIDTGGDVDALVNLVLRDLRTNLANRLDQIKTAEMVQALFEDSGMLEQQEYINVHLEADPYAGQWTKGQGFKANPDLEKKTEESTEKVLRETMKPTEQRVKVSRRHKDEKTDMRDLLRGLADFIQRLLSIPSAGDAGKSIDQLVESAKFKIQTDMALLRQNVTQAAAASRNRTRKRKK